METTTIRRFISTLTLSVFLVPQYTSGLTITEAFELSLINNPAFLEAQSTFDAEQESIPQARALLLPTLDARAGLTYTKESNNLGEKRPGRDRFPEEISAESGAEPRLTPFSLDAEQESIFVDKSSSNGSINFSQPILNRNNWLEYKKSFPGVELAKLSLAEKRTALLENVSISYLDRLEADELLQINLSELEAVQNHTSLTQQRYSDGLGNKSDVFESESRVFLAKSDVVDSQTLLAQANHRINQLINQPVDHYNPLPDAYVPELVSPEKPQYWISEAELATHALKLAKKRVEIAEFAQSQSRAGHWPSVTLRGSYNLDDFDNDADLSSSSTESSVIGIEFNLPLFSGLATRSEVIESSHRLFAAQHMVRDTQSSLGEKVRNAYQDTLANHRKMIILESAHQVSKLALELRREGFLEGLSTNLDLLDAYREVFTAKRRWRSSVYNYLSASISLKAFLVDDLGDFVIKLDAALVTEN